MQAHKIFVAVTPLLLGYISFEDTKEIPGAANYREDTFAVSFAELMLWTAVSFFLYFETKGTGPLLNP